MHLITGFCILVIQLPTAFYARKIKTSNTDTYSAAGWFR